MNWQKCNLYPDYVFFILLQKKKIEEDIDKIGHSTYTRITKNGLRDIISFLLFSIFLQLSANNEMHPIEIHAYTKGNLFKRSGYILLLLDLLIFSSLNLNLSEIVPLHGSWFFFVCAKNHIIKAFSQHYEDIFRVFCFNFITFLIKFSLINPY